jgi:hypothetical protein
MKNYEAREMDTITIFHSDNGLIYSFQEQKAMLENETLRRQAMIFLI